MEYLIDADWSIDYLTGRPSAHVLFPTLRQGGLAASIITSIELYTGVYGDRDPKQSERELRMFLRVVKVLPISHRVMLTTARLHHDLTLVTSNIRDYQDIPNLKLLHSRGAQR